MIRLIASEAVQGAVPIQPRVGLCSHSFPVLLISLGIRNASSRFTASRQILQIDDHTYADEQRFVLLNRPAKPKRKSAAASTAVSGDTTPQTPVRTHYFSFVSVDLFPFRRHSAAYPLTRFHYLRPSFPRLSILRLSPTS